MRVRVDDKVHWKYKGSLLDGGKEFDAGGYTATIGRNEVIAGVDAGLRDMCVGDKRIITLHHNLAYGKAGHKNVPPNADLVFEVQLLSIDRPEVALETLEAKLRKTRGDLEDNKLKVRQDMRLQNCWRDLKM